MPIPPALIALVIVLLYLVSSIKIITEYERAVVFRLGKLLPHAKGPGVVFVFRPIDRMVRVSLRTIVHDVPPAGRHHEGQCVGESERRRVLPGARSAARHCRSGELPVRHVTVVQTTLRSVLGQVELDDLLSQRDRLNQQLQHILDDATDAWGIKVSAVEVKHVDLPPDMQRAIARPGRGRTRAAGQGHPRRGRARGLVQARGGGGHHLDPAVRHHPPIPANAHGNRIGKELDHRLSAADRAGRLSEAGRSRRGKRRRARASSEALIVGRRTVHRRHFRSEQAQIDGHLSSVMRRVQEGVSDDLMPWLLEREMAPREKAPRRFEVGVGGRLQGFARLGHGWSSAPSTWSCSTPHTVTQPMSSRRRDA